MIIDDAMALADLTDLAAVDEAIEEAKRLGRAKFLRTYGFRKARQYFLERDGELYDSKAIAGVAFRYQYPERGALASKDFSGGDSGAARRLEQLGFKIVRLGEDHYQVTRPSQVYWWTGQNDERYWVEIRKVPGIGSELRCPLLDERGLPNPWYELLDAVRVGDVVYHWHARESQFVGRSTVAGRVKVDSGERVIRLDGFEPLIGAVDLEVLRAAEEDIQRTRDSIQRRHPGARLYLPFQMRSDGVRMMSNYFAKLPASLVVLFFGSTGSGDDNAADPPEEDGPPLGGITGERGPSRWFLEPFRPKADTEYRAFVRQGAQKRGRYHERLVNDFTEWLRARGFLPGCNAAIDIGLDAPAVIIEAKIVKQWARAVREAISQLYEYRYFQVVAPDSSLIFLASERIPEEWDRYLEEDRGIATAWRTSQGFELSPSAKRILRLTGGTNR